MHEAIVRRGFQALQRIVNAADVKRNLRHPRHICIIALAVLLSQLRLIRPVVFHESNKDRDNQQPQIQASLASQSNDG